MRCAQRHWMAAKTSNSSWSARHWRVHPMPGSPDLVNAYASRPAQYYRQHCDSCRHARAYSQAQRPHLHSNEYPQSGRTCAAPATTSAGAIWLSARGTRITPAALGLLASLGKAEVTVQRQVRVAFFSTGDELRGVGESLGIGDIYDSNRYTLYGMLLRAGVVAAGHGRYPRPARGRTQCISRSRANCRCRHHFGRRIRG